MWLLKNILIMLQMMIFMLSSYRWYVLTFNQVSLFSSECLPKCSFIGQQHDHCVCIWNWVTFFIIAVFYVVFSEIVSNEAENGIGNIYHNNRQHWVDFPKQATYFTGTVKTFYDTVTLVCNTHRSTPQIVHHANKFCNCSGKIAYWHLILNPGIQLLQFDKK